MERGRQIAHFEGQHDNDVCAVAFSPDGNHVATGSWDGSIAIWSFPSAKPLAKLSPLNGVVSSVSYSPDGRFLAGCDGYFSNDKPKTVIWRAADLKPVCDLGCEASCISFTPGGKSLIVALSSGGIEIYQPQS